jgi:Uma2 family endonuclease
MIRTQVQLTEDQARILREVAHQERTSIAELMRRALDSWLPHRVAAPDAEAAPVTAGARADQTAIAEPRGEYLVEAYRTEIRTQASELRPMPPPGTFPLPFGTSKPPPLEPGDRLTAHEFERRYHAMPHLKKAELIEGVVYMPSPVRVSHSVSHGIVMGWLGQYAGSTPGLQLADNTTLRLDPDNVVQPDALLRLDSARGGRSRISADDYLEGAPELIVEIATSSAAYDLYEKRRVYRRNGVQEYLVWQVLEGRLDWWQLVAGEYVALTLDPDGLIRSQVFPGLWLDP